jgi:two-component system, sensor histidine kinase and response regulator
MGMLGILLDSKLTEDQRDIAETARSSAQSLLSLINDILDFSKMEAQKLQLEKADFDLRDSIQSVVDLLAAGARKKALEIGCAIDADVPRSLSGDEARLRQILLNLLGNAIKFTQSGGAVIRVSRASASEKSVQLLFRVTDTGIGMSPEISRSLFQPFVQADPSTTRRFGGTGLGLAISKQLVTMMNGEIGVETEPGQGSTFWFTAFFDARAESAATTETSEAIRALIVDDSAAGRNLLSLQLSAWDLANDVASDSTQALVMLREAAVAGRPYNVIVSDLQMPTIDGIMLARLVKAQPGLGNPRFIVVSGTAPTQMDSATLAEKGVSVWLTKPIKERQLLAAVLGKAVTRAHIEQPAIQKVKKSGRILVADDNVVNQKVTLRQLNKLGCPADAVANGKEAIAALARTEYDLVLLDCHMPEMDGFEAAATIRAAEPEGRRLPIIALTASVRQEDRDRCAANGMDDFLAKPVGEVDLAKVLERWLPESAFDPAAIANLRSLAGDDASFMRDVMSSFVETADEIIATMNAGDNGAFGRQAHALAGSSRNVGATHLADLCSAAETEAYSDPVVTKAKYIDSIRIAYSEVRREIMKKDAA